MKTAKAVPTVFRLDCPNPECEEPLVNNLGTMDWGIDADEVRSGQRTVACEACDTTVLLPARFRRGRES